jgi:transcriptional regulator with XRE-family HTH domain
VPFRWQGLGAGFDSWFGRNPLLNSYDGEGAGARIRVAREALGFTQDRLAQLVGVSRSAVAQWETDRSGQVRANLARVAAALGVSVSFLVTGVAGIEGDVAETSDERALLALYRQIQGQGRHQLLREARRLALSQGISTPEGD